jgi:hypothetical protein
VHARRPLFVLGGMAARTREGIQELLASQRRLGRFTFVARAREHYGNPKRET